MQFLLLATKKKKTLPVLIWLAITLFFPKEPLQPDLPSQVLCFVFNYTSPLYNNSYNDSKRAILTSRPVSLKRNRHKTLTCPMPSGYFVAAPEFRCGFLIFESPFAQPLSNIALKSVVSVKER